MPETYQYWLFTTVVFSKSSTRKRGRAACEKSILFSHDRCCQPNWSTKKPIKPHSSEYFHILVIYTETYLTFHLVFHDRHYLWLWCFCSFQKYHLQFFYGLASSSFLVHPASSAVSGSEDPQLVLSTSLPLAIEQKVEIKKVQKFNSQLQVAT